MWVSLVSSMSPWTIEVNFEELAIPEGVYMDEHSDARVAHAYFWINSKIMLTRLCRWWTWIKKEAEGEIHARAHMRSHMFTTACVCDTNEWIQKMDLSGWAGQTAEHSINLSKKKKKKNTSSGEKQCHSASSASPPTEKQQLSGCAGSGNAVGLVRVSVMLLN